MDQKTACILLDAIKTKKKFFSQTIDEIRMTLVSDVMDFFQIKCNESIQIYTGNSDFCVKLHTADLNKIGRIDSTCIHMIMKKIKDLFEDKCEIFMVKGSQLLSYDDQIKDYTSIITFKIIIS